jgi:hypothetical protein
MPERCYEFHGTRIFECACEGDPLRTDRDAAAVVNAAFNHQARFLVVPIERLDDDFFRLKTRIAGEVLGKFAVYKLRVAIVGDISRYIAQSESLRDFVYECNRGSEIWFVANLRELETRLAQ